MAWQKDTPQAGFYEGRRAAARGAGGGITRLSLVRC